MRQRGTGRDARPACRAGAGVRIRSRPFGKHRWLSQIGHAAERPSEPQRPLILAILATRSGGAGAAPHPSCAAAPAAVVVRRRHARERSLQPRCSALEGGGCSSDVFAQIRRPRSDRAVNAQRAERHARCLRVSARAPCARNAPYPTPFEGAQRVSRVTGDAASTISRRRARRCSSSLGLRGLPTGTQA
jgi:hypothetical protein